MTTGMSMAIDDTVGAVVRTLRQSTRTDRRLWLAVFAIVTALTALFALGAPYFSGPDEPSHDARAWSVIHGQVLGADQDFGGFRIVRVPEWLGADRVNTECYRLDENVPAGCFSLSSGTATVESPTSAGSQLPFFYVPSGLPLLAVSQGPGLLLARMFGGAVAAAFVASAVVTARGSRARRWLTPSVLLACPPMFLYIAAVTNPSGLEIAAAISMWVSVLVLAVERRIDPRVVLRLAVAVVAVVLARQLGPLWVAVALGFGAWAAGWERMKELAGDRSMRLAALATAVSGVVWAGWILVARPLVTESNSAAQTLTTVGTLEAQIGRLWGVTQQAIGVFGYLDVRLPLFTYLVWIFGTVVLLALCWMFGSGRLAYAAVSLLLVSFAIQMAGEFRSVDTIGFFWQGRYSLPMLVGVPLLAAIGLGTSERTPRVPRRAVITAGGAIGVALFLAYYQMLRRYMVGAAGPLRIWNGADWTPPVPAILLLLAFAVATVAWVLVCAIAGVTDDGRSGDRRATPASFEA